MTNDNHNYDNIMLLLFPIKLIASVVHNESPRDPSKKHRNLESPKMPNQKAPCFLLEEKYTHRW